MKKLLSIIVLGLFLSGNAYAEIVEFSCPITNKSINKIKKDKERFLKKIINFNINTSDLTINYLINDTELSVLTGVENSTNYKLVDRSEDPKLTKDRYKNVGLYNSRLKVWHIPGVSYSNYTYEGYVYWGGTKKKGLVLLITDPDDFRKAYLDGSWFKRGVKNIFNSKRPEFLGTYVVILKCN